MWPRCSYLMFHLPLPLSQLLPIITSAAPPLPLTRSGKSGPCVCGQTGHHLTVIPVKSPYKQPQFTVSWVVPVEIWKSTPLPSSPGCSTFIFSLVLLNWSKFILFQYIATFSDYRWLLTCGRRLSWEKTLVNMILLCLTLMYLFAQVLITDVAIAVFSLIFWRSLITLLSTVALSAYSFRNACSVFSEYSVRVHLILRHISLKTQWLFTWLSVIFCLIFNELSLNSVIILSYLMLYIFLVLLLNCNKCFLCAV